ncbi:DUF2004 domain-containing protein [Duganella sp. HH105]|uniref:DUF2004 domain-containing protein n=1 Tax=Duganella sp. HH105 TaxID=1781067 RepID=UPI000877C7C8|nr:DUF2004 domain-containing protein [Duganella sp. HH105]OEZ62933.1 hypothetical protein DUGA6_07240 [Duganella sp. HH105]
MVVNVDEVVRREKLAIAAIKRAMGTEDGDVNLFVSHHLDELDGEYWLKHLGTESPDATQILDIIRLRSHWGGDEIDGIKNFDFTLPDDVTDYVISVSFDETGEVDEISMES